MDTNLEIRIIKKFFKKEKQDRYIAFVSSINNRKKFLNELSHLKDLKWELFQEVRNFNLIQIANLNSNQLCYVISEDPSFDQSYIDITDINEILNSGKAMILVFGNADQIYYEGEPPNNRYLSIDI